MPINLGVNGVVFRDTFALEGLDEFPRFEGQLHLDFENTFPADLTSTIDFLRLDGGVHRDTLILPAGSIGQGLVGEGLLSIPVNAEMMLPGGELRVEVTVNSMGAQPFTGHERVRVQGRLDGTSSKSNDDLPMPCVAKGSRGDNVVLRKWRGALGARTGTACGH